MFVVCPFNILQLGRIWLVLAITVIAMCIVYLQLDFSVERFKVLQTNVASYKKEISLLREKSEKLAASNAKYEEVNSTYRMVCLKYCNIM